MEETLKTTKICSKCGEEKELNEFSKRDKSKDGCRAQCKQCVNEMAKIRYQKGDKKKFYIKAKNYRNKNLVKINEREKEYRKKNKNKIKIRSKNYGIKNREKLSKNHKIYRSKNIEELKKYDKEYKLKNKDKQNIQRKERHRYRYDNDILYKIKVNTRNRIKIFLKTKNITINNSTFKMVGCTPQELKEHLEKQFTSGMTWDNYGLHGWHIDHIIPISLAKNEEEVRMLSHYTNLQPLWAKDNYDKSNKIE